MLVVYRFSFVSDRLLPPALREAHALVLSSVRGGDFEVFHAALIAASLLLTTPIAANAAFVIYYCGAL